MDQKQFEAMLSDAETRLGRLKMLYEQWFMGFERIEPAVLRKELDDLLTRMRKEQSNNTALRFRLQQLIQRHTTFTTYWRRIGRQIEEGTYQRDVLRAKRKRSRGEQERDNGAPELELSYDVDLDDELEAALQEANRVAETPAAVAVVPVVAAPAVPAAALPKAVAAIPAAPAKRAPPRAGVAPAPAGGVVPPPPLAAGVPVPAAAGRPAAPSAAGARANSPRSLSPFSVPAVNASKPAAAPASAAANQPRPAAAPVANPAPAAGAGQAAVAARVAAPPAAAARAAAQAAPAAARPAQAVPAAVAPRDGAFSTDDVQRVYTQYLAARKQNAERVDNVRRETIEKTIRGMLPQLEKKHAGKRIDFEVVVKDGKVALKPVAK